MFNKPSLTFLLVLAVGACGDDGSVAADPDAGGDADASADSDGGPVSSSTVLATGPDFAANSGIASTIAVPALDVQTNVVAGVFTSDSIMRVIADRIYVVNRFGFDNVTVLDRQFGLIEQIPIGAGSNPQDLARSNGKLYVATYNGPGVSIISESDLAGGVTGTIDLSGNDPDGDPNCASIAQAGGKIFVSCQLLDGFSPRATSIVAVIDPSTDTVVDTLTLNNANPFSFLLPTPATGPFGGDLLVSTVPDFANYTDGCIERISTGSTPAVESCLVTNSALGGYVSVLDLIGSQLVATVTTCQNGDCFGTPSTSDVARIEADGTIAGTIGTTSSHPTDLTVCPSGQLVVGDTDYADTPGVRVYSADGTELTQAPLDIGLPPAFSNGLTCF